MSTTLDDFTTAADKFSTIPVYEQFFIDTITPIQMFQKLKDSANFILESKDSHSKWARYSFIGLNPYVILQEENGRFIARTTTGKIIVNHERFREALLETLSSLKPKPLDIQIPFTGGGVGYIGYDGISEFEPTLAPHPVNDLKVPNFYFSFCETIIAFDHELKEVTVITHVFLDEHNRNEPLQTLYEEAKRKIHEIMAIITKEDANNSYMLHMPKTIHDVHFENLKTNIEKDAFLQAVLKAKTYIEQGEISQVVLSQRFEREITVTGLDIYRVLRIINPSPYMFYLKFNDFEVVGSSPEKLVQVNNGHIEIHPIAGTRPRGRTKEEDEQLAQDLLQDKKEREEHDMLVELAKQEIERVAKKGTVQVPAYMEIGYFSHVIHIISKVTGILRADALPIDALISAFPAGTLTGAPKLRAMEIIREVEPMARNLYGGAIGYIGFDGNIDSCIAIRSIFIHNQTAYIQAGAGVVSDSVPEREWEETRNKAKALIKAIEIAEELFQKKGVGHVV